MLYQVIKGAFDTDFIARIEDIAADLPTVASATVEEEDNSTRECDLRWINYGTPEFAFAADRITSALRAAGTEGSEGWEIENLQYTAYGPGAFHNWHIDAYRRSYNKYDFPLGDRFIGKKRTFSISILLNGVQCFSGGTFEISMFPNGQNTIGTALETLSDAGDMAVFDSSLCHRVAPVHEGLRKSLVVWICA
jgi:hypothetical protein